MGSVFIAGLINLETTLAVEGFPIEYTPNRFTFFGVRSTVSGVGYNISKALTTLGEPIHFAAFIGQDGPGSLIEARLREDGIRVDFIQTSLNETPQSVILYDLAGRRQCNTDLKDIQEQVYPVEILEPVLNDCGLAAVCNINFARPLLPLFKERGIPIATDVHTLSDLNDAYNRDFMAAADILFMSDEKLPEPAEQWARQVLERYHTKILVIGLGSKGSLLVVRDDDFMGRLPALATRPIVNTIGAGDALFSAFVHRYVRSGDPYEALKYATLFAGHKIGFNGGAQGFLNEAELEELYQQYGAQLDFVRSAAQH